MLKKALCRALVAVRTSAGDVLNLLLDIPLEEGLPSYGIRLRFGGTGTIFNNFHLCNRTFSIFAKPFGSHFPFTSSPSNNYNLRLHNTRHETNVLRNLRLATAQETGFVGLAPAGAEQVDAGCIVPVVLLRVPRPAEVGTVYMVVGECYVHGVIEGGGCEGGWGGKRRGEREIADILLCRVCVMDLKTPIWEGRV